MTGTIMHYLISNTFPGGLPPPRTPPVRLQGAKYTTNMKTQTKYKFQTFYATYFFFISCCQGVCVLERGKTKEQVDVTFL